jgi:uncharacterized membrane protein
MALFFYSSNYKSTSMILVRLFYIAGVVFIVVSIFVNYWLGKRSFNRRNAAGIEIFNSYKHALWTGGWENLVAFLSILLRVVGIILILTAYFDPKGIIEMHNYNVQHHF